MHESITSERVLQAVERRMWSLENPGICVACGADAEGVDPDARRNHCEACGRNAVFGADELLLHFAP